MENTITDYDLDDYFRELSTKYKSREVQISRYLKNKISDNKKVIQKNIDIAISQIRDWYNRRRYIRTCCYCPNFTFQDNNESYERLVSDFYAYLKMRDEIKNNMSKVVSILDEMVKWSKQKNLEYKQEKEQVLKSMTNKYNTYLTNSEIEYVFKYCSDMALQNTLEINTDIYVVELKQIYEAYKVYLHGLIYNDEISRINKNNNTEIEILDDYKPIKI